VHAIDRIFAAIILSAITGLGIAPASAQTLVLPDLVVTAPTSPPPPSAQPNPYFGKLRVEEDKWPEIPCDASRIGAAAGASCRKGPRTEVMAGDVASSSRQQSNCNIAHDLVIGNFGGLTVEADILVFDPYYVSAIGHQNMDCYVHASYTDLREAFPDLNQMTRQGQGWRNFLENADMSTMEFSIGEDNCLALQRRGPVWRGGYIYLIHASICRKDRQPVNAADVTVALGSLQIRQHDPVGNLRRP